MAVIARVSMEQIHDLAEQVRQELAASGKGEAASQEIGDLAVKHLKKLDRVAYVRFASVYKRFEEPEDFKKAFRGMIRIVYGYCRFSKSVRDEKGGWPKHCALRELLDQESQMCIHFGASARKKNPATMLLKWTRY